tara:strand:+ start:2699 stop:3379 length:681 start_codon:yes stop_codon:yes gene_type:complete
VKTFSYEEYKKIIDHYSICDFKEIGKEFTVLRHDVEFSPERALKLAKINEELNVQGTFFFQVFSDAYNTLSDNTKTFIYRILDLNQKIGLHVYVSTCFNWQGLEKEIVLQKSILKTIINVDRLSFHRPKRWMLEKKEDYICDLLNVYGPSFFELGQPNKIKYFADSNHTWKYGHPLEIHDYKKIQLNLHVDSWSKEGELLNKLAHNLDKEHSDHFKKVMKQETKHL